LDAFEKSDKDGKIALHQLTEKLELQDKQIAQSIRFSKWFQRYESDKIKGRA